MTTRKESTAKSHVLEQSAGVIPVFHKSKKLLFLVVQHQAGHWGFPKGHIEKGEGSRQTALRELREEAGINLISLSKRTFKDKYMFKRADTKHNKTVTYYLGKVKNDRVYPQKSEIRSYRWLPYERAYMRLCHTGARRALAVLAKAFAVESLSAKILHKERSNAERSLYRRRRN